VLEDLDLVSAMDIDRHHGVATSKGDRWWCAAGQGPCKLSGGPLPGDGPCGERLAAALGLGHLSGDRAAWRSCARGRDDVSGKLFLLAPVEEKLRFDISGRLRNMLLGTH